MTRRPLRAASLGAAVFLAACSGAPVATDAAAAGAHAAHAADAADAGFVALFDGRSLDGWTRRGGAAEFRVEDGAIVGETRPDQPNSFLCTTAEYDDFELEFEFRIDRDANSGVQFRSRSLAEYRRGLVHGYQFEIDPSPRGWTGGVYEEGRRGWLADLKENPAARAAFVPDAWNHGRVLAVGARVRTWVNGTPAADLSEERSPDAPRRGFVALQVHGVGRRAEPLQVRWRALRLRPLPSAAQNGG